MSETHAHRPPAPAGGMAGAVRRRGPVDPVLALMHRHYELCAEAVDPLEIAAGLQAHGITDRVAARFRHRDVFALAEELYARVPREPSATGHHRADDPGPDHPARTARRALRHLLPGLVCAAGVVVSRVLGARPALPVAGIALAAVALTARAVVRRGPLRAAGPRGSALWTCWLLAFALFGSRACGALGLGTVGGAGHGPGGPLDPGAAAGLLAAAFAVLPAAWCARRFARRARALLAGSRGLAEFAAALRPLLAGTLALFTLALLGLLVPAWLLLDRGPARPGLMAVGGCAALALLLFTARLLALHGFPAAAAAGTGAACAVEAAALALAALPPAAAGPLRFVLHGAGPGCVQAVVCSAAAIALAGYAFTALASIRAHGTAVRPDVRPDAQPYDPAYAAALFGSPHAPDITSAYAPCLRCATGTAPRTDRAVAR